MNFQLPPNSAIRSAARSAIVIRFFCSSLTLRDTRCCNIRSVVRRREKVALNISRATIGVFRMKRRKFSRDNTARRASSMITASAERFLPSIIAISPKKSPRASSASTISFLSSSVTAIRTRPLSIRYIASPSSPARNRAVPVATSRVRSKFRNSPAAESSSEAKSGTERSASSVISWGVGVDIALPLVVVRVVIGQIGPQKTYHDLNY